MRTFSVSSIYSIDNIVITTNTVKDCLYISFDIEYPDGIRNSKKAFKNLLKSSTELREIISEEVRLYLMLNDYTYRSNRTYATATVLGKNCNINIYLGSDCINKPINAFIEEILRKVITR